MNIIKADSPHQIMQILQEHIQTSTEGVAYCVPDKHYALVGLNSGINAHNAESREVPILNISYEGGTIVTSEGDVQVGILTKGYSGDKYRHLFIDSLVDLFKSRGLEVTRDKNDILIDNKKVIGYGSRMFGDMLFTAIQISVGIDSDLITSICTKKSGKTPDGLINYNINTQDILDILFDITKKF